MGGTPCAARSVPKGCPAAGSPRAVQEVLSTGRPGISLLGACTSRAPGSLPGPPCHLWSRRRRRAPTPADAAGRRPLTQPRLPCCSSSGCVRVSVHRQRARPFLDLGASSPVTGTPTLCPWIWYFLEARPLRDRKTGICFTARAAPAPGTPRRRNTPEVEGGRGGASRTDHVRTCSQHRRRCSHKWGPGRWGSAPSARHPQLSTTQAWGLTLLCSRVCYHYTRTHTRDRPAVSLGGGAGPCPVERGCRWG